jgi:hypothetical protein
LGVVIQRSPEPGRRIIGATIEHPGGPGLADTVQQRIAAQVIDVADRPGLTFTADIVDGALDVSERLLDAWQQACAPFRAASVGYR